MKKKKIFVPNSTKVLLALTSLAGTVGLWNVISNQSLAAAQQASEVVNPPADLSPLPSVVPLVGVTPQNQSQADNTQQTTTSQLRQVPAQQQVAPPPANSGSGASAAPAIIPAPVTSTGSSK
jgi:hypothetical protein